MKISGRVAIVTGGGRGLGRRIVQWLVEREAQVTVLDVDADALADVARELGVQAHLCDVSDPEQVAATVAAFHRSRAAADILVNNAGVIHSAPLVSLTGAGLMPHPVDEWRRVLAVNLDSVFYVSSLVVERMIETRTKGVIVNVSSVAASGHAGQSAYAAAKSGVNALTVTWARELGPMGIRVAAISPGFLDAPSTHAALSPPRLAELVGRIPLRRLGTLDEAAASVIHVIENDYINGRTIQLDGGYTA